MKYNTTFTMMETSPFKECGMFSFELYMFLPEEKPIPQQHKWGDYETVEDALKQVELFAENSHPGVPGLPKVHFCLRRLNPLAAVFCAKLNPIV
jgi:hypothetical protein